MQETEILSLIEKYLGRRATSEEETKLLGWYRSYHDSEIEIHLDSVEELNEIKNRLLQKLHTRVGEIRSEELEAITPKKFKKRRVVRWVAAAALVLAGATGYWLVVQKPLGNSRFDNTVTQNNTVLTMRGFKTKIVLPDGSNVWLNADSKITYDKNFVGAQREVSLTGEAFFDVVKDKARAFIVHTQTIDLKVLGTSFNVRAYENEKETETALMHGSIEVTVKNNPGKKIILKPNEKLIVKNQMPNASQSKEEKISEEDPLIAISQIHYYKNDSSAYETSWIKNRLAFNKEPLEKIALKIERWFNVKVTISDPALKDAKYQAVFENETLEEVMEALRLTGNFHYAIEKGEVIIK
ncbi:MAG TPA: FecR domain-containing protein [Chitinophagaceae bacterium]|jgi:ferric-dicitrate binding protein FerR (iron transport regulator)|nr:FecR domain-containing protein [Chitinophagaceae bacterium]